MRVLAISSASHGCLAGLFADGRCVARGGIAEEIGLAGALPVLIGDLLERGGRALDLVAVVVGPGSFTGLRAGISVAAGVGLGLGVPVVGVSVAEALAAGLGAVGGRAVWTAVTARRGRVFIDQGSGFAGWSIDALPMAGGPVAVCGNAAMAVAASLAARGGNVMLTDARVGQPAQVASVGVRRLRGELAPLSALPLYVDAPEAKLPAGGLRAPPA